MIIWLIGMAGSGKTSIGRSLYSELNKTNEATVFLDGDHFRTIMKDDLGHSLNDRRLNGERMLRMCSYLDSQGIDVVCCILSIFPEHQQECRRIFSRYIEVYIDVSMDELIRRDQKGLYTGALSGDIKDVVGIDIPFPRPANPDLVINNDVQRSDFLPFVHSILQIVS